MPLVNQCPNSSTEMATLSTTTLEVFDSYKSQIEGKDSDDESIHLPLPLTDDEADVSKNSDTSLKDNLNESEDDILNKFESSDIDIDIKCEDTLLNDDIDQTIIENTTVNEEKDKITTENKKSTNDEVKETLDKSNEDETFQKDDVCKNDNELIDKVVDKLEDNCSKDVETNCNTNTEIDCSVTEENGLKCIKYNKSSKLDSKHDKESEKETNKNGHDKSSKDEEINKETEIINDDTSEKEKCQNDSPSTSDSEDLLQISVVRDAEEDNAENALDEVNRRQAEMERQEEEEEQMDQDEEEEEGSGKDENEQILNDEVDIDESNSLFLSEVQNDDDDDKIETSETPMNGVSDEINSEMIQEHCDSVNITNVESVNDDSNNEKLDTHIEKDKSSESSNEENSTDKEKNDLDKENNSLLETADKSEKQESTKRPLPNDVEEDRILKKSRLDKNAETKETPQRNKEPLKSKLLSLEEYMKSKDSTKKLTLADLEQFCLQKMCEAIVHQSQLGDLHHQLKMYEQTIETMRREITQLTKQTRDLEIVNKKLMNDLRQHNPSQKLPMPLKITRSVGLQVKFAVTPETPVKRKASGAIVTSTVTQTSPVTTKLPRNTQNTIPLKQGLSPQKPQKTTILNQVLTNNRRPSNTPPTAKTKTTDQRSGVIDLTDEDDKNKLNTTGNRTILKSRVPQSSVRPTFTTLSTSGKITPITSVVTTSSTPQLMYVVQSANSGGVLGTNQKTVLVNLQPTNGVLTTSPLNGQTMSMIPKQGNTIQLKSVVQPPKQAQNNKLIRRLASKHPAPLPSPPQIRMNDDRLLKSVPPKPVLTIRKTDNGIILQWKMPYDLDLYEAIASYQLYAYQETTSPPSTEMWRRVGDVKALALPMACTLTQFADKNKYYFAVRPVDIHKRIGAFSEPEEISL